MDLSHTITNWNATNSTTEDTNLSKNDPVVSLVRIVLSDTRENLRLMSAELRKISLDSLTEHTMEQRRRKVLESMVLSF